MSVISCENAQKFKNIVVKLSEDIFKEVCSLVSSKKEYIFTHCEYSSVLRILNFIQEPNNVSCKIDYIIDKFKNKLQKEASLLKSLIHNDLPVAEIDYDIKLKNAIKQIIKNVFPKLLIYTNDKKINEIISVYFRNIDIIDIEKTNHNKFKFIMILNKIRSYKLFFSSFSSFLFSFFFSFSICFSFLSFYCLSLKGINSYSIKYTNWFFL